MIVKLLTERNSEFLSLKGAVQACLSLHLSKCHIVQNSMSRLRCKNQGCGNTMPDLSDLVPFHSVQVENFYLLVLGQVQMY